MNKVRRDLSDASQTRAASTPPSDFQQRKLAIRRLPAGTVWHRFHGKDHDAKYFGNALAHRFDDLLEEYGVLYAARHLDGAFVEVFLRDPGPYRFVTLEILESKILSTITTNRSLKLVDLAGIGLTRMGIDNRLGTGSYTISQQWSRAFQSHTQQPDGILYRSRHYPRQLCAAIFSTTQVTFKTQRLGTLVEHLGENDMYELLDRYGLGEF